MSGQVQNFCHECGRTLPQGRTHGLCSVCLMAQAMAGTKPSESGGSTALEPPLSVEEMADRFPQFEVVDFLGRGGMGVVYKARQKSLDRWVAIKVIASGSDRKAHFADRFEAEAKTLAKMSHPNIVTVFDHGVVDGLYYIVMEYVDGVNLRDLLREGKMEPEQALAIVPPICEALEYAHGKGVVHRDIKPENLLLDREGRVKIADFGIASLVGATSEKSGTPPYMAPEQSGGNVDRRADIYALGVVLYEMLTGERPATDVVAPSRKVQIDVRIDEMVLRALEKEPEKRYQTAGEFRTVVETIEGRTGAERNASSGILLEDRWFRSSAALKLARVGWVLGCVGFLGFLSKIPSLVSWKPLFGMFGFLGLVGVAVVVEAVNRSKREIPLNKGPAGESKFRGSGIVVVLILLVVFPIVWGLVTARASERFMIKFFPEILITLAAGVVVILWKLGWKSVRKSGSMIADDPSSRMARRFAIAALPGSALLFALVPGERHDYVLMFGTFCSLTSMVLSFTSWETKLGRSLSQVWLALILIVVIVPSLYLGLGDDRNVRRRNKNQAEYHRQVTDYSPISVSAEGLSAYAVQNTVDVHFMFFYDGEFKTSAGSERSNAATHQWTDEGKILLSDGYSFEFFRGSLHPMSLMVNGIEYDLAKGRLFVIEDHALHQMDIPLQPLSPENIATLKRDIQAAIELAEPARERERTS